jgi:hypothetical protein
MPNSSSVFPRAAITVSAAAVTLRGTSFETMRILQYGERQSTAIHGYVN